MKECNHGILLLHSRGLYDKARTLQFTERKLKQEAEALSRFKELQQEKEALSNLRTKYAMLYKPSTDLVSKPVRFTVNKENRLLEMEQEKKLQQERLNKLNSYLSLHPSSLHDYQSLPRNNTKSKFKLHFGV